MAMLLIWKIFYFKYEYCKITLLHKVSLSKVTKLIIKEHVIDTQNFIKLKNQNENLLTKKNL